MPTKTSKLLLLLCALGPGAAGAVTQHAVLWSNGALTDLGTLGGNESLAFGINDAGQVVGKSGTDVSTNAFLWSNGTMTNLGHLNVNYREAYGINDAGKVVGFSFVFVLDLDIRAFLWSDGVMDGLSGRPS